MNEAAAASKALEDVANNQVIMMELVLYAIISIVLVLPIEKRQRDLTPAI